MAYVVKAVEYFAKSFEREMEETKKSKRIKETQVQARAAVLSSLANSCLSHLLSDGIIDEKERIKYEGKIETTLKPFLPGVKLYVKTEIGNAPSKN